MATFNLVVEPRSQVRKGLKQIRANGMVPVVIYGVSGDPQSGQVNERDFVKLYSQAGESTIVDVSLDSSDPVPTLIHTVDWHPVTDRVQHVDFLRIDMNKAIEATVHLKHINAAPAVKEFGGVVITTRDTVTIKCLPKDLVHEIDVDLAHLEAIGDTIHIKDLAVPDGITIMEDGGQMLVSIAAPRTEEEQKPAVAADATATVAEGATAEGEGEKKSAEGESSSEEKKE